MLFVWWNSTGDVPNIDTLFKQMYIMKSIEEVYVMISIMSDDMPIYEFNMMKHRAMASIDRSAKKKRAPKKKHAPTRIDMEI